jgi:hypothetical protein
MGTEAGKFNKASYDRNNQSAMILLETHLKNNGFKIIKGSDAPEDYKIDIVAEKDGKEYEFEVETNNRDTFTTVDTFKWDTVSFVARKKKMCDCENPYYYVVINPKTEWFFTSTCTEIFKEDYFTKVGVNTTDRKGQDEFYRLPKELVTFKKLDL